MPSEIKRGSWGLSSRDNRLQQKLAGNEQQFLARFQKLKKKISAQKKQTALRGHKLDWSQQFKRLQQTRQKVDKELDKATKQFGDQVFGTNFNIQSTRFISLSPSKVLGENSLQSSSIDEVKSTVPADYPRSAPHGGFECDTQAVVDATVSRSLLAERYRVNIFSPVEAFRTSLKSAASAKMKKIDFQEQLTALIINMKEEGDTLAKEAAEAEAELFTLFSVPGQGDTFPSASAPSSRMTMRHQQQPWFGELPTHESEFGSKLGQAVGLWLDRFKNGISSVPVSNVKTHLDSGLFANLVGDLSRSITEQNKSLKKGTHNHAESLQSDWNLQVQKHKAIGESTNRGTYLPSKACQVVWKDFEERAHLLQEKIEGSLQDLRGNWAALLQSQQEEIVSMGDTHEQETWSSRENYRFSQLQKEYLAKGIRSNALNRESLQSFSKQFSQRLKLEFPTRTQAGLLRKDARIRKAKACREAAKWLASQYTKDLSSLVLEARSAILSVEKEAFLRLEGEKAMDMLVQQQRERHHQLKQLRAERAKVLEVQVEEAKIAMQRQLKLEKSQEKSRLDRLAFSKELIAEWNQLKLKQQEENLHAEKEQAVAQEEERQLQNIVNQQRVAYREDLLKAKQVAWEKKLLRLKDEEEQKQKRLDTLRATVTGQFQVERDFERLLQNTVSTGAEPMINHRIFQMDGFSNDQMFANKQFRLQNALFKAGVHETDYGKQVMRQSAASVKHSVGMKSTVPLKWINHNI